mgnify:CR=1 FL=1
MPAPIPGRIATQIRINEIVYKKTKHIANQESRNTNAQIEYFVKLGVEAYEQKYGPIVLSENE